MKKSANNLVEELQKSNPVDFIIYNTNNYKSSIKNSISEILEKYKLIIEQYLHLYSTKINPKKQQLFKFLFQRGIDTINNVFNVLFYYTKNLELTYYHTQKAYSFYIEFVQQTTDETISYLNLTSRDATMFVYKKTIFEINNDFKKKMESPSEQDLKILNKLDLLISIYKIFLTTIIKKSYFSDNKIYEIQQLVDYVNKLKLGHELNPTNKYIITDLLNTLYDINMEMSIEKYYNIVNMFINHISSNNIKLNKLNIDEKIYNQNIFIEHLDLTPTDFIKWLFE
jgi:hypothetical protein